MLCLMLSKRARRGTFTYVELNALALKYQAEYGGACRDVDVAYFINNPDASGVCRVFRGGLEEEGSDLLGRQLSPLSEDAADALLVSDDAVKALPQELFL